MTTATFETATLADAVGKASRFAPNKGSALDKSAGVVMHISPDGPALIRSTDLAVFFRQHLIPSSVRGLGATWRVPSRLFNSVLAGLPMHLGSTVVLADKDNDGSLYLKCGGVKAKLTLISPDMPFPRWEPFDPEDMGIVEQLADRLGQVGWCTEEKGDTILSGIHMDGQYLYATNRDEAVRVPLACPVEHPVTAPLQLIHSLVKDHPEVHIRIGTRLELSTDPDTQLEVLLLEGQYPKLAPFLETAMEHELVIRRDPILAAIERLLIIVQGERYPTLQIEFEGGLLRLTMDQPEVGRLIEELEVPECAPFKFFANPLSLKHLLSNARQGEVRFHHTGDPHKPIRVMDDQGYVAVAMPRRKAT